MSNDKLTPEEEKRINQRSFVVGMFIALAFIVLLTILYFAGLVK